MQSQKIPKTVTKAKQNVDICQSLLHKSFTNTGLPHGQEKSGKTQKNDKSQVKIRVFEKSQEKFYRKLQILSVKIYKIPNTKIPSIGKKFIRNILKKD